MKNVTIINIRRKLTFPILYYLQDMRLARFTTTLWQIQLTPYNFIAARDVLDKETFIERMPIPKITHFETNNTPKALSPTIIFKNVVQKNYSIAQECYIMIAQLKVSKKVSIYYITKHTQNIIQ